MSDIDRHDERFITDGYTIMPGLFPASWMQRCIAAFPQLSRSQTLGDADSVWLNNGVERAPDLFLPAAAHPRLLDFLELAMGPFVQLDNLTFFNFASQPAGMAGRPSGWHRDIWQVPPSSEGYQPPDAMNAICYFSDLDAATGPLRVIPGSHRRPVPTPVHDAPHPEEVLVHARAGDVILIHCNLFHSGTANVSGGPRWFWSAYYNRSWLRTRDNHAGPNARAIVERALGHGDTRVARLFGHDPAVLTRCHGPDRVANAEQWRRWIAEDLALRTHPDWLPGLS